jgi:hypothetical protein
VAATALHQAGVERAVLETYDGPAASSWLILSPDAGAVKTI